MENESSLGQPIPTAVLTATEIKAPSDPVAKLVKAEPSMEPMPRAVPQPPTQLFAEMMFAPIVFWASVSASYLRLLDAAAKPAVWPRFN